MSEPGSLWSRQDGRRQQDEHRHETIKAIRRGDTAWALRNIAGPDAAIDYLQAMQGAATASEPGDGQGEPGELRWPHRVVTTIEQLLANVASTPAAIALRVTRIDGDGDAVVEAQTDWVGGPPAVAIALGAGLTATDRQVPCPCDADRRDRHRHRDTAASCRGGRRYRPAGGRMNAISPRRIRAT